MSLIEDAKEENFKHLWSQVAMACGSVGGGGRWM